MEKQNLTDFSDLAADLIAALTLHPSEVDVAVNPEGACLVVSLSAPRAEVAMVIGRGGDTARALHRVLSCVARNWGHEGDVRLAWTPSDS